MADAILVGGTAFSCVVDALFDVLFTANFHNTSAFSSQEIAHQQHIAHFVADVKLVCYSYGWNMAGRGLMWEAVDGTIQEGPPK